MKSSKEPTSLATQTHALAIPKGMESAFGADEWNAMTPEERNSAMALFHDELASTTDGLQIQFPRVKFPTAGAPGWLMPSATGEPMLLKTIEGIVVYKQPVRAWWPLEAPVGKNPPTCSSLDGVKPVEGPGKQATSCAVCPHGQWGTGKEGRGQACKSRINVFLMRDDEDIPTLVSLPPTALRTFSEYAVQLRQIKVPLVGVTTIFGLTKAQSGGGVEYQALTLSVGRKLPFAEMNRAVKIRAMFEAQMARRGVAVDDEETHEVTANGIEIIGKDGVRIDPVVTTDKAAGF